MLTKLGREQRGRRETETWDLECLEYSFHPLHSMLRFWCFLMLFLLDHLQQVKLTLMLAPVSQGEKIAVKISSSFV